MKDLKKMLKTILMLKKNILSFDPNRTDKTVSKLRVPWSNLTRKKTIESRTDKQRFEGDKGCDVGNVGISNLGCHVYNDDNLARELGHGYLLTVDGFGGEAINLGSV